MSYNKNTRKTISFRFIFRKQSYQEDLIIYSISPSNWKKKRRNVSMNLMAGKKHFYSVLTEAEKKSRESLQVVGVVSKCGCIISNPIQRFLISFEKKC